MKQKKKVGIITFHASHNYGSMLQAYALQQTVLNLGYECDIINFRTSRQKKYYRPEFVRGSFVGKLTRTLLYFPFILSLLKKHRKFEQFLNERYHLSDKEYATLEELEQSSLDYDIYISGSDQIWNPCNFDFDWAYFLPFVGNAKRISYAPSMGQDPDSIVTLKKDAWPTMKVMLTNYDYISVREQGTQELLRRQIHVDSIVTLDPTLLLDSTCWNKMAGDKPLVKGKYIFLYAPRYHEDVHAAAEQLSRFMKIPIVISLLYNTRKGNICTMSKSLHYKLATGPIEFLNLCKFATCTIGQSFHLVVFSILFRTPFYAINGMNDSRIKNLLTLTGLTSRGICSDELTKAFSCPIDFDFTLRKIAEVRNHSLEWLQKSLSNN